MQGISFSDRPQIKQPVKANSGARLSFGVILFDNPENPTSGYACEHGAETQRIASPLTLGNSCLWLTNASFNAWWSNLRRHPLLRHSAYLRLSLDQICEEWGIPVKDYPKECTPLIAEIFSNCMHVAQQLFPQLKNSNNLKLPTLASCISQFVKAPVYPSGIYGPQCCDAIENATQNWSHIDTPNQYLTRISLVRPRVASASIYLNLKVPEGNWTHYPVDKMGKAADSHAKWLLETGKPFIAQVELDYDTSSNPDNDPYIEIFALGMTFANEKPRRTWLTPLEFIFIADKLKMKLLSAYICDDDGKTTIDCNNDYLARLQTLDGTLSWSAGIVMENTYTSLLRAPSPRQADNSLWPKVSPRAAILRGRERMDLMLRAIELRMRFGIKVLGYGSGRVMIETPESNIGFAIEAAYKCGLEVPLSASILAETNGLLPDLQPTDFPEKSAGKYHVNAFRPLLATTGDTPMLKRLDALPLMSVEKARNLINSIF
ncbi:hypothetical protein SAMN02744133_108118 [Thalassospira xiamenensis M-5 = DSM 17429]|uniref:hypothetical protein n=1 Tax=Thalassospira xiamenensis TaxID=220697 RepID=UPI00030EAA3C|nr:hypothetical protein [Thalassospira xiamenensis]SIT21853.1 hypothetical protein SAMN02744133_108118 [Thalassospira xiamenensis M-5 = DSM 17429]